MVWYLSFYFLHFCLEFQMYLISLKLSSDWNFDKGNKRWPHINYLAKKKHNFVYLHIHLLVSFSISFSFLHFFFQKIFFSWSHYKNIVHHFAYCYFLDTCTRTMPSSENNLFLTKSDQGEWEKKIGIENEIIWF